MNCIQTFSISLQSKFKKFVTDSVEELNSISKSFPVTSKTLDAEINNILENATKYVQSITNTITNTSDEHITVQELSKSSSFGAIISKLKKENEEENKKKYNEMIELYYEQFFAMAKKDMDVNDASELSSLIGIHISSSILSQIIFDIKDSNKTVQVETINQPNVYSTKNYLSDRSTSMPRDLSLAKSFESLVQAGNHMENTLNIDSAVLIDMGNQFQKKVVSFRTY